MKSLILILLFSIFSVSCFSQILPLTVSNYYSYKLTEFGSGFVYNMNAADLTDFKTAKYYRDTYRYGEASRMFYSFYKSYPNLGQKSIESLTWAGRCAYKNNEYERAERIIIELLDTEFQNDFYDGMSPDYIRPSRVSKSESCGLLASMFIANKSYVKALKYLDLAGTKYRFFSFCGNCQAGDDLTRAEQYALCYKGLGRIDDAIAIMKQYVFPSPFLIDNSGQKMFAELMIEKYGRESLQMSLLSGIENIYVENGSFYLDFMNEKYDLRNLNRALVNSYNNVLINKDNALSNLKSNLQNSILYKLIME